MEKLNLDKYTLTTEQIAAKLKYSPQHVRVLAKAKRLPALKRGRAWLFSEEEVTKHLQAEATKSNVTGTDQASDILR